MWAGPSTWMESCMGRRARPQDRLGDPTPCKGQCPSRTLPKAAHLHRGQPLVLPQARRGRALCPCTASGHDTSVSTRQLSSLVNQNSLCPLQPTQTMVSTRLDLTITHPTPLSRIDVHEPLRRVIRVEVAFYSTYHALAPPSLYLTRARGYIFRD